MPKGPKGEKRPADVIGNAVKVMRIAIWTVWYNWVRIHKTLRVTPAMAAGLTDRLWAWDEIVAAMDEIAPKPGRPATYKKRAENSN